MSFRTSKVRGLNFRALLTDGSTEHLELVYEYWRGDASLIRSWARFMACPTAIDCSYL